MGNQKRTRNRTKRAVIKHEAHRKKKDEELKVALQYYHDHSCGAQRALSEIDELPIMSPMDLTTPQIATAPIMPPMDLTSPQIDATQIIMSPLDLRYKECSLQETSQQESSILLWSPVDKQISDITADNEDSVMVDLTDHVAGVTGTGIASYTAEDFLNARAQPLSADKMSMLISIYDTTRQSDWEIITVKEGINITFRDIKMLRPLKTEADKSNPALWSTSGSSIIGGNFAKVSKKLHYNFLRSLKMLFFPVAVPAHWVLFIVHPYKHDEQDRVLLQGVNSIKSSLGNYANFFFDWIIYEAVKMNIKLDHSAFHYQDVQVPCQHDTVNCGVFVLKHILYTLDNMYLNTDLCSMNHHRQKWCVDILRGRMEHVFPPEIAIDQ